jgi:alpha-tubulin suppressor-like RCC1 family protein
MAIWMPRATRITTADSNVPVGVPGILDAVDIAAGEFHSCVVLSDGSVWCWGANPHGELGDGTQVDWLVPTQVASAADFAQVTAGVNTTCAADHDGIAWCWGWNLSGRLGLRTSGDEQLRPQPVYGLTDVLNVSASEWHTCAVTADGSAWCWGLGPWRLGTGPTDVQPVPAQVISP